LVMQDLYDLQGRAVPRVFVSAREGVGLDRLRSVLAESALAARDAELAVNHDARGISLQNPAHCGESVP
jgi:GTPase